MPAIPFPRVIPADIAGCEGHEVSVVTRKPMPYCVITCERYGHAGSSHLEPAVTFIDGTPHCPHHRPLLSADQIAAVDEQAGLHATHCAPAGGGEKSLHRGSVDSTTTEGAGS